MNLLKYIWSFKGEDTEYRAKIMFRDMTNDFYYISERWRFFSEDPKLLAWKHKKIMCLDNRKF